MKVIELKEIQKVYGKHKVLEHVSFSVEKGHIVGLIGPNGAGKTTIMKIIGGLAHATDGQLRLFESEERLDRNRDRISFMIENPIIDGSLTAMENMKYVRLVRGVADASRCEKLLQYVGLGDTGKKAGGGGGGGKGPGSLTNLEEDQVYYDSEFVKNSQLIGMVVGQKQGQAYIKAASILASINDDGDTQIKLSADKIDIDGLMAHFEAEGLTCGDIDCGGSITVDQDVWSEGTVGGFIGSFDSLIVGEDDVSWQTETIPTFTFSQTHNFVYRTNGVDYTTSGKIIGTNGTKTIHYLGKATT